MKHLLFFYATFSYSIGFISLVILVLAYLKSGWKPLKSIIYFLSIGTIQLVFLTCVEYRLINIPSWFLFSLIFQGAYLYSFLIFGLRIKNASDVKERNFYVYCMAILLVLSLQTVVPFIKNFPENVFVFATGYFYINIFLLKYVVNRFFNS